MLKHTIEQKKKKLEILEAELKLSIYKFEKSLDKCDKTRIKEYKIRVKKDYGRVRIQKFYINHHTN